MEDTIEEPIGKIYDETRCREEEILKQQDGSCIFAWNWIKCLTILMWRRYATHRQRMARPSWIVPPNAGRPIYGGRRRNYVRPEKGSNNTYATELPKEKTRGNSVDYGTLVIWIPQSEKVEKGRPGHGSDSQMDIGCTLDEEFKGKNVYHARSY